ncbi:MAG: [LysW]-lysine hydrolase [Phycisphaeraceae bacterium]|nr:[LysW]-lysine hydrolase [Phycisphaeraceae bacterium]
MDLLRSLVSIPSVSGDEGQAAGYLASWLDEHGVGASIDPSGSVVGIAAGSDTGRPWRDVVLLGHIDTVPGHITVRVEEGELWGRGSVDAKGSLAAFAVAAVGLTIPPGVRLVVIGATEEESPSSRGANHAAGVFNPQACVIGEPSGHEAVTIAYKGRLVAHARIDLPAGHSAGPHAGASERAVECWSRARSLAEAINPDAQGIFGRVQARLQRIASANDGLRDTAELEVGFRLPPGVDPLEIENSLRREWMDVCAVFRGHEFAYSGDPRSWLAGAFTAAIRGRGATPRLLRKTGTSDMNVVARRWGCPIVAYGPGDSSLDHAPDERLSIAEYLSGIATLRAAIPDILARVAVAQPPATRE